MRPRRYPARPPAAAAPRPVVLVKLGGSLITDKRRSGTARPAVIRRLARELAAARAAEPAPLVVLGHGSGSFGHVAAAAHGLAGGLASGDRGRAQLAGIAETQARAAELHRRVLAALGRAGVPAFSIAPSSALVAAAGAPAAWSAEPVALALGLGMVPVVYGDVVLDRARGVAICSTEQLFAALAERLPEHGHRVARVLWLGETAGVLDARGRTLDEIAPGDPAASAAGAAAGTDVTGGMRHRLETALALAGLGVESWILDGRRGGALTAALAGSTAGGTRVRAR